MASLLDSEAQFLQRQLDLRFSEDLKRSLRRNNLVTFGNFAYSHGQPGQQINDESFETWFTTNVLQGASIADIAGAKRLLFESQTMVLAHLQNQVQLPDTSSVKKVPAAERDSKMAIIRRKLTGLLIEGPMEPGHHLLDLAAHMYQTNEIRYIAPERCISRTHEVMTQKVPTKQLDVAADSLVVKEKSDVTDMVVTSALQVQEALQRRGLALVFADVIMHDAYTRYLTTLFSHLHREPPPGYSRCTVSQLVAADKMVWQTLLEEGVKPRRDDAGDLALNVKLLEALQSYRVSFSLLPLLAKANTATGSSSSTTKPKGSAGGKGSPFPVQKPWVKNKGGKSQSKGKMRVPQHIYKMGGTASNPAGEPICFAFNSSSGCADAADGARCRRGHHICAKCYNVHPIHKHPEST